MEYSVTGGSVTEPADESSPDAPPKELEEQEEDLERSRDTGGC